MSGFFSGTFFDFGPTAMWSAVFAVFFFFWVTRLGKIQTGKYFWRLLGAAVFLRVLYVALLGHRALLLTDGYYYRAESLYEGRGFLSPVGYPTAYFMPGYTLVLWALFHVLGGPSHWAVYVAQIGFGMVSMGAVLIIGRVCFDRTIGVLGGVLLGFFPSEILQGAYGLSDLSFEASLWAGIAAYALSARRGEREKEALRVVSGLFFGFAALDRPYGLLMVALFVLWAVFCERRTAGSKPFSVLPTLGILAVTLFVYAPWVVRNAVVFNRFVPFSTCGGVNLWLSNNPNASGKYDNLPEDYYRAAAPTQEMTLDHKFNQMALDDMRAHPWRFLWRIPKKWAFFLGSDSTTLGQVLDRANLRNHAVNNFLGGVANGYYLALFGLSVWFAMTHFSFLMGHPARGFGLLLLPFLLAVFAFYHVQTRYHMPLLPFICLLAASGIRLYNKDQGRLTSGHGKEIGES